MKYSLAEIIIMVGFVLVMVGLGVGLWIVIAPTTVLEVIATTFFITGALCIGIGFMTIQ